MTKDEREYQARAPTAADDLICNVIQTTQTLVYDEVRPPSFAITVMAKLGQIVASHDGTFPEDAFQELKEIMLRTFEVNYRHFREEAEGKFPKSKGDLN